MTRNTLVPIGMSGNCRELFDALRAEFDIPAILDDAPRYQGAEFEGTPILPINCAENYPSAHFISMIGSARSFRTRKDLIANWFCFPNEHMWLRCG